MVNIFKNPKERTRFLKFTAVGCIGFVVDFGVMNLLLKFTGNPQLSTAISDILAFTNNFFWNRYWTYPDAREKPLLKQFLQFIVINLIGLGIRLLLFETIDAPISNYFKRVLPSDFFMNPKDFGHNVTQFIAMCIVGLWNFFANRMWTYNDVSS